MQQAPRNKMSSTDTFKKTDMNNAINNTATKFSMGNLTIDETNENAPAKSALSGDISPKSDLPLTKRKTVFYKEPGNANLLKTMREMGTTSRVSSQISLREEHDPKERENKAIMDMLELKPESLGYGKLAHV